MKRYLIVLFLIGSLIISLPISPAFAMINASEVINSTISGLVEVEKISENQQQTISKNILAKYKQQAPENVTVQDLKDAVEDPIDIDIKDDIIDGIKSLEVDGTPITNLTEAKQREYLLNNRDLPQVKALLGYDKLRDAVTSTVKTLADELEIEELNGTEKRNAVDAAMIDMAL